MEKVEVPKLHEHPLIPFTRVDLSYCCAPFYGTYIYGGYRCNEMGCETAMFHKECVKPLQEINHSCHPDHPLKLINEISEKRFTCTLCKKDWRYVGYCCSKCESFTLDMKCARRPAPPVLPDKSYGHAYHTCHPKHPLKSLESRVPDYADKKCLLFGDPFDKKDHLHHCDICNVSICTRCKQDPPPLAVVSPTTHEHQLHLVPRRMHFTCNACGTLGDRSPYFCLECNFMIHRQCIDLPRVININRHDHRISYTPRLGHGEWQCTVYRKKVDGFFGGYSYGKCPTFTAHARCATHKDVWDMVEREGTSEEEEIPPFEVIDDITIKHFNHQHNLQINEDGQIQDESTRCVACVVQICSDSFYSCQQCDFILHEKCANLPRKRRHFCDNQPFTLHADFHDKLLHCGVCGEDFIGFWYASANGWLVIDTRCGSVLEPFVHASHPHPLYYDAGIVPLHNRGTRKFSKRCRRCGENGKLSCDDCDFSLCFMCAMLPQKVLWHRYDDHPLYLCCGESNVKGKYWCEACELRVNPNKWFYTCNDCGVVLHISCIIGDLSYKIPVTSSVLTTSVSSSGEEVEQVVPVLSSGEKVDQVVSNSSVSRPICCWCKSRCMLPSFLKCTTSQVFCSVECYYGGDAEY